MTALVTGGTGFVGAHVVRALLERGAGRVRCLARPASDRSNLDGLDVDLAPGDLRDPASLAAACRGCEEVYHCAADYRLFARDPSGIHASNTGGTRNLLAAARKAGARRIVYTSSVAALGLEPGGAPADETTPVEPAKIVGHYKRSKYDAERVAEQAAAEGAPVVIVNPSTPVGELVSGAIGGRPVLIAVSGIGPQAARAAAEACVDLARQGRCRRVVWIGIAGALSPGLKVGDLIVATSVTSAEERHRAPRPAIALDRDLAASAISSGCAEAVVVSTPAPVVTADERRRLWRLVGSPDRAAVDMESCEAARVLDAAGLPFAVLRAVSDTSEDDLPMALKAAATPAGGVSIPRLALAVLRRPRAAAPLAAVRFRAVRSARALADAAAALA